MLLQRPGHIQLTKTPGYAPDADGKNYIKSQYLFILRYLQFHRIDIRCNFNKA